MAYAATNLAAFAVVLAVQRERRSVDLHAFDGLAHTHPWWTAGLALSLLSLLGLPPLAGFVGKLEVFSAAIDAGQSWLAVVAIANTVVSLYYYLRVLAPAVLDPPPKLTSPIAGRSRTTLGFALATSAAGTVAIGVVAEPLLHLSDAAHMLMP
jgi:NADH-quinone oxidoreductase subunit N